MQTTNYEEIKDSVDSMLVKANVTYSVVNVGVRKVEPQKAKATLDYQFSPATKAYEQDAWRVTFTRAVGGASSKTAARVEFDYFTGIGLRWLPSMDSGFARFLKDANGKPRNPKSFKSAFERRQAEVQAKPINPRAADVLYCLVSDAEALNTSFTYWCSDLGYDEDSISALNTYNSCCEEGKKLRQIFDNQTLAEIAEAVREL